MSNPTPNYKESNTMKDSIIKHRLERIKKGTGFISDWVDLLHYKCPKEV